MAFGWGTDGNARATDLPTLEARFATANLPVRYYRPEVHKAAFALPGYVKALLA